MARFSTARMEAVPLAPEHLEDLVRLHLDPEVCRYIGGVRTAEATASYLERNIGHWRDHGVGLWVLHTHDGDFVGRAGLRSREVDGVAELNITYTLAAGAWGKGLASEIAVALVDHWAAERAEPGLVGVVMKGNEASERVLAKAGFLYDRDIASNGEDCTLWRLSRSALKK